METPPSASEIAFANSMDSIRKERQLENEIKELKQRLERLEQSVFHRIYDK